MDYKGSDLTIRELLSALERKAIGLSESKIGLRQFELAQYVEKLGDISLTFKRCLNKAAAVNRLPLELLTRLFKDVQIQRPSTETFPHYFALSHSHEFTEAEEAVSWVQTTMHVCNYWREVVLCTPSLWTYIHFNVKETAPYSWHCYPPTSLLPYSRLSPLHLMVTVHSRSLDVRSEPTHLYDTLRIITARTETLQLTSVTLCLNMGGLSHSIPSAVPATIFAAGLPQLRRLCLWFYASWSYHTFPNLTHISLHNQHFRPSVDQFLDLLESTPRLEFLFLSSAGPRIGQGDLLPQRTVPLPSLHSVHFESQAPHEEHNIRILECITIRRLTHCSVIGRSAIRHNRATISPVVIERTFTHINPEEIFELRVYQYKRHAYGLEVDASRISLQTMLYTPVDVPSSRCNNIQHLHLLSTARIPEVNWEGFPNLLSITCYDSLNGINELVTSLSRKTMNEWPCPLLKTIYLPVGEKLPSSIGVKKQVDRDLLQGVLDQFPESIVVPRNPWNSYRISIELRPEFPEEFDTEASVKFPVN
ncbi:hypothetical protein M413DRAFT_32230 [Hebeloma cylindrosporum]|uniref:Uncharacterized protein n=1 Tax=Hebeloma cylindrosporum TaxID=76867 RepID=A0A0C3BWJ6_HEBCY|nr:hypothetical protein M413DRAFT_32230 [Hebeloma cylindrosporum h7]